MKVLVFGASGQVGGQLRRLLPSAWGLKAYGRAEASFDDPVQLEKIVDAERPDFIINAAAYTAVDRAETEIEAAEKVNRDAPAHLARAAQRAGSVLVHYSTDYVYDGAKDGPYHETDVTNPLSVYGRTKLEGDHAIAESGCRHIIFRVSWVYAKGHANFPRSMLNLAKTRESLNVVSDQIGAPTDAHFIAEVTRTAIDRIASGAGDDCLNGVFHLAPRGVVNRADLARFIVRQAGERGMPLALREDRIIDIPTSSYPMPAARPLNSHLDTSKLVGVLGIEMPDWHRGINAWVTDAVAGERT